MEWLLLLLPLGFLTFIGCLFWPLGMLIFTLLCSWWWPFRAESAATLAAAALDVDEAANNWRRGGFESEALSSTALSIQVKDHWIEWPTLLVDGTSVPLTLWDTFKLFWAICRWDRRNDRNTRQRANAKAAAKAREWRRKQSERTGA